MVASAAARTVAGPDDTVGEDGRIAPTLAAGGIAVEESGLAAVVGISAAVGVVLVVVS